MTNNQYVQFLTKYTNQLALNAYLSHQCYIPLINIAGCRFHCSCTKKSRL